MVPLLADYVDVPAPTAEALYRATSRGARRSMATATISTASALESTRRSAVVSPLPEQAAEGGQK